MVAMADLERNGEPREAAVVAAKAAETTRHQGQPAGMAVCMAAAAAAALVARRRQAATERQELS